MFQLHLLLGHTTFSVGLMLDNIGISQHELARQEEDRLQALSSSHAWNEEGKEVWKRKEKKSKNSAPLCYFLSVAVFPPWSIWILAQSSVRPCFILSWVNGSVPENQNSHNAAHWHTCVNKVTMVCIYIWTSLNILKLLCTFPAPALFI